MSIENRDAADTVIGLEKAISIAVAAHKGRVDKAGAPYILHPLRVMMQMDSFPEMVVAVLHDVVEDSEITFENLRQEGFPEFIIEALHSVTRKDGEDYLAFVRRAAENPIGRKVKLSDLKDNMDLTRIESLTERDIVRVKNYHEVLPVLKRKDG